MIPTHGKVKFPQDPRKDGKLNIWANGTKMIDKPQIPWHNCHQTRIRSVHNEWWLQERRWLNLRYTNYKGRGHRS